MFLPTALIYGTLSACAAFLLEVIGLAHLSMGFFLLLSAALIEEGLKLLFLFQWQRRFGTPHSSLVTHGMAALLFGLGFSSVEIWLAAPIPTLAALQLGSVHTATSLILGVALFLRKTSRFSLPLGLMTAITLHTLYNFFIGSLQ